MQQILCNPGSTAGGARGRREVPLHHSLMFRVPAILAGSVLVILGLAFTLMELAVKPRLRDLADKSAAQSSAVIGEELRRRVTVASTLCQELARSGELLPKDEQEHLRVLPRLIGGIGDDWFIAGGGVWPEPGQFTPGLERRCFFFGREPDGRLKYYDDYNNPTGPGYHHEEWYVPVRFVAPGKAYWSRSYVDPYSHEPMVTCSTPMYRDGQYYGVATIDVKLSGLRELFERSTREIGGYAFAVDREGVFLTFPEDALIRTVRTDANGMAVNSFHSARELAEMHSELAPIASAMEEMDREAIGRAKATDRFSADVVRSVDADSYQIDALQAELIVGLLNSDHESPQERRIDTPGDIQLNEACVVTIGRMPGTGWKIVTVMPKSRVFASSQHLYRILAMSLGGVMVIGLGGMLLVLHRDIVRPITRITSALGGASEGRSHALAVPAAGDGEIGLLASTINEYASSLAEAMRSLAAHRDELESRIAERTSELRESNTQLDRARRDADAASRAKSEFLANMSHEIRTPLTAILGFADLLRDDGAAGAPGQNLHAVETIKNAGAHLLTVINDILDLSKIEANRMTIEDVDTPLISVIREVDSLVRPRAQGKGVQFRAVLREPVPDRIVSDPTRLRQILMNLAGNAAKFTESGSVTIGVRTEGGASPGEARLIIDIEDTGPGMSPQQAERLFSAFSQADGTITRKHGGTGLGLTISRRLASLMHGSVDLVQTEPGKGSCFRLTLPLRPAAGARLVQSLDAVQSSTGPKASVPSVALHGRILLAEDGMDNQRLISFHLRKAGASVDVADNGRVALEMFERARQAGAPYGLLLTDIQMPEMDGHTLARTLRSRGSGIPIVAITAHAMAEERERCLAAGCDDYASKPIDKGKLIAQCAAWLGKASPSPSRFESA